MARNPRETLYDLASHLKTLEKTGECSPNSVVEMEIIKDALNRMGYKYDTVEDWSMHYVKINLR